MAALYYESSFAHHGVKGQKWGVRRYQNPDGTLTKAGRQRKEKVKTATDITKIVSVGGIQTSIGNATFELGRKLNQSKIDSLIKDHDNLGFTKDEIDSFSKQFRETYGGKLDVHTIGKRLSGGEDMFLPYAKQHYHDGSKFVSIDVTDKLPRSVRDLSRIDIDYNLSGMSDAMHSTMANLSDVGEYITAGQVVYNVFKGIKLVNDIYRYTKHKSSAIQ